jgi:hypothetical protein
VSQVGRAVLARSSGLVELGWPAVWDGPRAQIQAERQIWISNSFSIPE